MTQSMLFEALTSSEDAPNTSREEQPPTYAQTRPPIFPTRPTHLDKRPTHLDNRPTRPGTLPALGEYSSSTQRQHPFGSEQPKTQSLGRDCEYHNAIIHPMLS